MQKEKEEYEVLGIRRLGNSYHWFLLFADGIKAINCPDDKVIWKVDKELTYPKVVLKRNESYDEKTPMREEFESITIKCDKDYLKTLMRNVGIGSYDYEVPLVEEE